MIFYLLVVLAETWNIVELLEPHLIHLVGSWDVEGNFAVLKHCLDPFSLFKLLLLLVSFVRIALRGTQSSLFGVLLATLANRLLIVGQQRIDIVPLGLKFFKASKLE